MDISLHNGEFDRHRASHGDAGAIERAMAQIEAAITRPVSPDVMLDEVLAVVLSLFACDRVWLVGPVQTSADVWQIYAEKTVPEFPGHGRDALFSAGAGQRFAAMVAAAVPMRDDIEAGHGMAEAARKQHCIRAQLALAIQPPAALPCVLGLHQCSYDRVWTEQECTLLAAIGQRLGPAFGTLHAYRLTLESERRLAHAELIAHVGYWEVDLRAQRVRTSAEYCRIFGFADQRPLRDMPSFHREWRQRIHPDDRARVRAAVNAALAGERPYTLDYRLLMGSGEIRYVRVRGEGLDHDEVGTPKRWFGTAQDITETRNLEEQLRHAQKMEALGLLAGGITHEFNNLLMVILGHAEIALGRMSATDINRKSLTEVVTGSERATALTRQLLAFCRQQALNPELLSLGVCLAAWRQFMRPLISEDIDLVLELGDVPGLVYIDRGQFEQAMTNLVINARDAMPDGGVIRIEVTSGSRSGNDAGVHAANSSNDFALISIHDQGHGMDESTQARAFEPFFTTKPAGRGTGLGLAMVYGFVTQSGGHIEISSALGTGTCVRLYLPLPRTDASL